MDDRKPYLCPHCLELNRNTKLAEYPVGANSQKIYIKCRWCKKEVEIKIGEPKGLNFHEPNNQI